MPGQTTRDRTLSPVDFSRIARPTRLPRRGVLKRWSQETRELLNDRIGRGFDRASVRYELESVREKIKWTGVISSESDANFNYMNPLHHGDHILVFDDGFVPRMLVTERGTVLTQEEQGLAASLNLVVVPQHELSAQHFEAAGIPSVASDPGGLLGP